MTPGEAWEKYSGLVNHQTELERQGQPGPRDNKGVAPNWVQEFVFKMTWSIAEGYFGARARQLEEELDSLKGRYMQGGVD